MLLMSRGRSGGGTVYKMAVAEEVVKRGDDTSSEDSRAQGVSVLDLAADAVAQWHDAALVALPELHGHAVTASSTLIRAAPVRVGWGTRFGLGLAESHGTQGGRSRYEEASGTIVDQGGDADGNCDYQ